MRPPFFYQRQQFLRQEKGAFKVDVDHLVKLRFTRLGKSGLNAGSGIVH